MKIIEFYNKGVQVVVEGASGDRNKKFSSGPAKDVQIGYVPTGKAKPVEGARFHVLEHGGSRYLLLRKGYIYDVSVIAGEVVSHDKISAEHDHIILPLGAGVELDHVGEAE